MSAFRTAAALLGYAPAAISVSDDEGECNLQLQFVTSRVCPDGESISILDCVPGEARRGGELEADAGRDAGPMVPSSAGPITASSAAPVAASSAAPPQQEPAGASSPRSPEGADPAESSADAGTDAGEDTEEPEPKKICSRGAVAVGMCPPEKWAPCPRENMMAGSGPGLRKRGHKAILITALQIPWSLCTALSHVQSICLSPPFSELQPALSLLSTHHVRCSSCPPSGHREASNKCASMCGRCRISDPGRQAKGIM
jgi:hypothetical protein